jgi:hypothetical protein
MTSAEERLVESTRQISRLYHDNVNVDEAIELMRCQNISAEVVKDFYYHLSTEIDESTEKFHYYTIEDREKFFKRADYWTSRYLFTYDDKSLDYAFHEITIFDSFNNKST